MPQAKKIYFDESGFTGNNLLHPDQTIFSYASVQIEEEEASDLVTSIIRRYNVQNGELKGANLVKFNKGRRAISEILSTLSGRMKVSVSEKKYALAAKFFEYIFEPPLQKNNSLFYSINFHRFISSVLYVEFMARVKGAEKIFEDFERLMRTGDFDGLDSLFSTNSHPEISPFLKLIREFAILNRVIIADELNGYAGEGAGKWILDLTSTALFSLLAEWGSEFDQLTAICDQSKPLADDQTMFNTMINREDKQYSPINGKTPITFNLSGPLQLVDSKLTPAVQLADCVAAAFAYACNRTANDDYANKWREYIESTVVFGSVFADTRYVELEDPTVQLNAMVLLELVRRSEEGVDLIEHMPEFLLTINDRLVNDPIQIT